MMMMMITDYVKRTTRTKFGERLQPLWPSSMELTTISSSDNN